MSQQDIGKKKALEAAISLIEKQFGEGSVMTLGQHSLTREFSVIKTGALALDIALGIGGVPRGRIIEIYGPESSGKSTLATHIVANAQKTADSQLTSMPSMLSILVMQLKSELTSMNS